MVANPKPNILIMEDDPNLRRLYSKALIHAGYEVYAAGTIIEAACLLDSTVKFDVFICDLHMGAQHSHSFLRVYRERLLETQVIIISGQAHFAPLASEFEDTLFLQKPVDIKTLVHLLTRLLKVEED